MELNFDHLVNENYEISRANIRVSINTRCFLSIRPVFGGKNLHVRADGSGVSKYA